MTIEHYKLVNKEPVAVPLQEWAEAYEKAEDRIVRQTTLDNGKLVSTVFLGLDHQFGTGPPLLFETMVFPTKDGGGEIEMDRYSTWEEAETGHEIMVEKHKGD